MANLLRSAKSGSVWGSDELEAFNIVVRDVQVPAFFTTQDLPPSPLVETAHWNLESDHPGANLSHTESDFFFYMKAVEESESLEPVVDDFTLCLLRILGFTNKNRKTRQRLPMQFVMSGTKVDACADVTLVDGKSILLLVKKDKLHRSSEDPEGQLIAGTIAAFYENHERLQRAGLPTPEHQAMLGVTMVGTAPIFYRVIVTEKLLRALRHGSYPEDETVVLRLVPPVPEREDYLFLGMRPLGNRRTVFRCFEGFKALIPA